MAPVLRSSVFKLLSLPDELLCRVSSFLDVPSLNETRRLSRKFRTLMSTDKAGWLDHFRTLQTDKVHVAAPATDGKTSARQAYMNACLDAKRNEILFDELCFEASKTVWSFRFKRSAGLEWTAFDPWQTGQAARQMVFMEDGQVQQLVGDIKGEYELRLPFSDATAHADGGGVQVKWRMVDRPLMDDEARAAGAYLRLTVGGRDVPTYVVRRNSRNWSFTMENCWGVFSSFPIPLKTTQPSVGRSRARTREENIFTFYQMGVENSHANTVAAATGAVADGAGPAKRRKLASSTAAASSSAGGAEEADLASDASLNITTRLQWREALLYNIGMQFLPDGPHAEELFQIDWQRAVTQVQNLN